MADGDADWRGKPVFDRACYDQLMEYAGDVGEILAVFRQVLPERKAAMLLALANADLPRLKGLAHTAKSGAFTLGLLRLGALCETIEKTIVIPGEMAAAIAEEFDAASALLAGFAEE
jgi:HPt (histidine-containing phosphotransfer) domain-containing protein